MKLEWETIYNFRSEEITVFTKRLKVINGWLIKNNTVITDSAQLLETLVFVPDSNHEWNENKNVDYFLEMSIDDFDFSVRTYRNLKAAKIFKIKDLLNVDAKYLLRLPNFGRKSLKEVIEKLKKHNLSLKKCQ